ncbi:MAG: hypothetical protein V1765_00015 [bacterium]
MKTSGKEIPYPVKEWIDNQIDLLQQFNQVSIEGDTETTELLSIIELNQRKIALLQKFQDIIVDEDEIDNSLLLVRGCSSDKIIITTDYNEANYGNIKPGYFIHDKLKYFRGKLALCVGLGQHRPSQIDVPWFLVEGDEGIIFWPLTDAPAFSLLKTCWAY